ncbi:sodium-dependent transporter [Thermosediminibacter litoriperuensis]|uniref:NSS family neurotransmitter:Na+ symporter n=1 Tax=Thermosediminibacter litoriperuensis TaxID=291989 RepID=A0A5S5AWQ0_9FIRM|nr:sodium-dependent transporter [Thermosediminibacter litoriperuensis]TYP57781.1 NSS family neurotransmitter:Na+ symporter [Thermosediminibacter litoriperuensis]
MSKKESFATRFGFIAAAMGQAVGTGNVWRFPRVATANGGGPFLVAYMIALLVWCIPLLIAEVVIGRRTRKGTVGAFRDFIGERYTWMGAWIAFVCFALGAYYSVTMGWTLRYFVFGLMGVLKPGVDTQALWEGFIGTPWQGVLFHLISVVLGAFVVFRGVEGGIEKASKILIPSLFGLLILGMGKALTLPGAVEGFNYLFNPDFGKLISGKVWLEAFTQAAWSTGAGWGFMITYAVYTREKEDVAVNSFITGLADTSAALIASMTIVPTVFALAPASVDEIISSGNTGLTFIWLARLFPQIPGGGWIATVFFLAMAFAALTSLYAMYEVVIRNMIDAGWDRKRAAAIVVVLSFLGGLPSAVNINFLNNQDQVWGVALLVSGLLVAFALTKYGLRKARIEDINPVSDIKIGVWWDYCIRIFPLLFAIIFGWWVYQEFTWYPDSWWNPFEVYSPATMFAQWAIIIVVLIALNKRFARAIPEKEEGN